MILLSLALNFAGLSAFALGMDVHHRALFARTPALRGKLKAGGALLQSLALSLAILCAGFSVGFVEWIAGLAAGGFILALLLSLRTE